MTSQAPATDKVPTILDEDRDLLAVDKPAGLAAIPERDLAQPSAQRRLEAQRGERLFVVHRLDKEVSGLLLFARTAPAHRALSLAFERREVDKRYLGLVWGEVVGDEGEVALPIREFGSGRMGVDARGKASLTRWSVLARGVLAGRPVTLLALSPHTGRRHQLRVHCYAIGHALVGDPRYGDKDLQATQPRLMLHAHQARLSLGADKHHLVAPPPEDFVAVLRAAGVAHAIDLDPGQPGGSPESKPNSGSA